MMYMDKLSQHILLYLNMAVLKILKRKVDPLDRELGPPPKPSIEEAPKLELKTLPSHQSCIWVLKKLYLEYIL